METQLEEVRHKGKKHRKSVAAPIKLSDVKGTQGERISTGFEEFDRVLGGGIVRGAVTLLSGDPGIGKSTLLLELALSLTKRAATSVYYVTGEESEAQVKMRAERLADSGSLAKSNVYVFSSTDIDSVVEELIERKPTLVIIDSIQTMEGREIPGFPGSIPQVRYATSAIVDFAKTHGIPVFLVGHVTKEGIVAGPMVLSHMVDSVLYLEGERFSGTRILRAYKNRFGDSSEVGIFVMEETGLTEVKDASNFFLGKKNEQVAGNCAAVVMEGSRPILVEIQALVVPSSLSYPRRVVSGLNERRCELLLAVIQKHLRLPLDRTDVFLNVVGGLRILETAVDLAVCLALVSSFKNKALPSTVAISEVGLLGELRGVLNLEKRIREARKYGFSQIATSKDNQSLSDIVKKVL